MYANYLDKKIHNVSDYQPSEAVKTVTKEFRDAFGKGDTILNKQWQEFNNYSYLALSLAIADKN